MRLGGEVNDGVNLIFPHRRIHLSSVADVSLNELITRIVRDIRQAVEIPGVGQRVEIENARLFFIFEKIMDEIRANEPRPARLTDKTNEI